MLRYETIGTSTILVDLHNGYSIMAIANWNYNDKDYYTTFYISRNDTYMFDLVQELENTKFSSDIKTIKIDITKYITEKLNSGFFDYYIKRYEYQQKCFERGNEMFEQERIKNDK